MQLIILPFSEKNEEKTEKYEASVGVVLVEDEEMVEGYQGHIEYPRCTTCNRWQGCAKCGDKDKYMFHGDDFTLCCPQHRDCWTYFYETQPGCSACDKTGFCDCW